MYISGSITWPSGVRLVFTKGHKFEGILEGPLEALKPFETRNITVSLQSPSVSGVYSASWRLCDLEGRFFGGKKSSCKEVVVLRIFINDHHLFVAKSKFVVSTTFALTLEVLLVSF